MSAKEKPPEHHRTVVSVCRRPWKYEGAATTAMRSSGPIDIDWPTILFRHAISRPSASSPALRAWTYIGR